MLAPRASAVARAAGIAPAAACSRVRLFMAANSTLMHGEKFMTTRWLFLLWLMYAALAAAPTRAQAPPSQLYGELFARVQNEKLFPDSKTFADASGRSEPAEIVRRYHE